MGNIGFVQKTAAAAAASLQNLVYLHTMTNERCMHFAALTDQPKNMFWLRACLEKIKLCGLRKNMSC